MIVIKFYVLLSITTIQVSSRAAHKYLPHNSLNYNSVLQPTCYQNEEYSKCGNEYRRHCRDIVNPSEYKLTEPDRDDDDGCFCVQGFYRNDVIDLCVIKEECYSEQQNSGLGLRNYMAEQRFPGINYLENDKRYQLLNYPNIDMRRQYMLKQVRDYYQSGKKKRIKVRPTTNARLRRNHPKSYAQNYQSSRSRCGRANEIYRRCGSDCGNTCNKIRESQYCHPNVVCRSGCFCINGYVRDDFGACITKLKCATDYSKCGKLKKYQKCGNYCNMLCADFLNPGHRVCDHKRCFPGCFCVNGAFMNGKNQCVPTKMCAQY